MKYDVVYSCSHEGEVQLFVPKTQRSGQIQSKHSLPSVGQPSKINTLKSANGTLVFVLALLLSVTKVQMQAKKKNMLTATRRALICGVGIGIIIGPARNPIRTPGSRFLNG